MTPPNAIPGDFDPFLDWLRRATETAWAGFETATLDTFENAGVGGLSWRTGTRWAGGLSEAQIAEIEASWNIRFPTDYRRFLQILNCPDRQAVSAGWLDEPPFGMGWGPDVSVFSDWLGNPQGISDCYASQLDSLQFDIEQKGMWRHGWGERPRQGDLRRHLEALVSSAPPLIPVTGHRFIVDSRYDDSGAVLSILGSDVIVYADSLRSLLLLEFSELIGLDRRAIVQSESRQDVARRLEGIPIWGDLLLANRTPPER